MLRSALVCLATGTALAGCGLVKVKGVPGMGSSGSEPAKAEKGSQASAEKGQAGSAQTQGSPVGAPPPASSPTPASTATATAPPPTEAPKPKPVVPSQTITFPEKGANPHIYGTFEGKGRVDPKKKFGVKCEGNLLKAPSLVVDAPQGLKSGRLVARGNVHTMLVLLPGGKYVCKARRNTSTQASIEARDWPAGKYTVYLGSYGGGQKVSGSVELEDLSRKRVLPWESDERPTMRVTGNDSKSVLVSTQLNEEQLARRIDVGFGRCREYAPESPPVRLEVTRRSTVKLGVRAKATGYMHLVGPMPPDNRNIKSKCLSSWDQKVTLEPGTYYLRLGMKKRDKPTFINFYAMALDATLAPLQRFEGNPQGLSVAERAIVHHFPAMTLGTLQKSDDLRRDLFLQAPKGLFVKARVDLDKHTAKALVMVDVYNASDKFRDDSPFTFPVANQPLLLLNEKYQVLAADGSIFAVAAKDLVPVESSSDIALTREPANPQLFQNHARKMAGPDDKGRMAAYRRRHDKFNKCADRVWARAKGRFRKLQRYPHLNRARIQQLRSELTGKANRVCKKSKMEKADLKLWAELERSRTRRRAANLRRTNARLEKLF